MIPLSTARAAASPPLVDKFVRGIILFMKNHHHNGPIHSHSPNSRSVIHEEIASRAYDLWERDGKPENQAEAVWLIAEQELMTGHRTAQLDSALPVTF